MGLPYQDNLNGHRITKAKNPLRTSAQSVADIAVSRGLADQPNSVESRSERIPGSLLQGASIFKKLTGHRTSFS